MLFREENGEILAVAQTAHAWIAGQILRAWREPLPEPVLFAADVHDIGWLDWEASPSFNPATGRPHSFREIGPVLHSPMWRAGVGKALAGWGRHVALLVSRHGGLIWVRMKPSGADRDAVQAYLREQGTREAEWARELGIDDTEARRQSGLIAFADALSLALCSNLKPPLDLEAPGADGKPETLHLTAKSGEPYAFAMSPWPFREPRLEVWGEGWKLPASGRFASEAEFRDYFPHAPRARFRAVLTGE